MGEALTLRVGDWVEVRSPEEILATLDSEGKLERLPFMPEMLKYCGRRLRVSAVAHKTCDPAHKTGGRRMHNAVHLEELRCDGSAHGGCQAACLLFWKTAWLRRVDGPSTQSNAIAVSAQPLVPELLDKATRVGQTTSGAPIYSCQATCLFDATRPLPWWDLRQYIRDLTTGNVALRHWFRVLLLSWVRAALRLGIGYRVVSALYYKLHRALLGRSAPISGGGSIPKGQPTPVRELGLRPGEWVRVRSNASIRDTLSADNKNRGMWFDDEMVPFCEGEFVVQQRVERIINEVTGEMMHMKTPCITLEGVHCRSLYSRYRLFCPRKIPSYWREIWLDRIDAEQRL